MIWSKAGSGKSLQLLKDKKADMIMMHAPGGAIEIGRRGDADVVLVQAK